MLSGSVSAGLRIGDQVINNLNTADIDVRSVSAAQKTTTSSQAKRRT